jgi:PAS domain S-box-containing protein
MSGDETSDGKELLEEIRKLRAKVSDLERVEIDQALRESEKRLRVMTENSVDYLFQTDAAGRLLYGSESGMDLFGYDTKDRVGRIFTESIYPPDIPKAVDQFKKVMGGETVRNVELSIAHKDGRLIPMEVSAVPIFEDQKITSVFGIVRDITERKRLEAKINEYTEQLEEKVRDRTRDIEESMRALKNEVADRKRAEQELLVVQEELRIKNEDLNLISHLNAAANRGESFQYIVREFSKSTERMFSCSGAAVYILSEDGSRLVLQNINIPGVLKRAVEKIIGAEIPKVRIRLEQGGHFQKALESSGPYIVDDPDEIMKMMSECTENPALKILVPKIYQIIGFSFVIGVPLRANERTIGLADMSSKKPLSEEEVVRFHNLADHVAGILQRKLDEEKLRQSEALLQTIADNFPNSYVSIIEKDLTVGFTSGQEFKKQNLDARKYVGLTLEQVFADKAPAVRKHYLKTFEGEEQSFELFIHSQYQRYKTVPLYAPDGSIPRILCVVENITEQKRSEEERIKIEARLQQAEKLESLGILTGGIAHDFNNLLMGVLGNADLALLRLSEASPIRPYIQDMLEASQKAADLVRQMLAYSGKGRFVIKTVNLSEIVDEMAHLLETSISKDTSLILNLDQNLPAIEVDITQVQQIIMNMVINAKEAVGKKKNGAIAISTGVEKCDAGYLSRGCLREHLREGDYVYLEISDNGCGMDKETKARIFDPFFSTKFTGRGLGLSAVLGIVRGHGGELILESEPENGTTFKVLFPALGSGRVVSEKQSDKIEDEWRGSGTVLLVDDEKWILSTVDPMLRGMGFDVITAVNGRECIDLIEANQGKIKCVLLDLTMPEKSGEEVVKEIGKKQIRVPIILSSGYDEQAILERFKRDEIAGFIQKPYRTADLREALRKLFDS